MLEPYEVMNIFNCDFAFGPRSGFLSFIANRVARAFINGSFRSDSSDEVLISVIYLNALFQFFMIDDPLMSISMSKVDFNDDTKENALRQPGTKAYIKQKRIWLNTIAIAPLTAMPSEDLYHASMTAAPTLPNLAPDSDMLDDWALHEIGKPISDF
jgi:hypothetical protein